ncbi:MAG: NAD(P)-dependent oxidoreductase [Candidatus Krumholzibacteria bacterium]|nr:NAD(P)-dependent oxidoreductase [Candidatus Krumholzibacteria bacterium]
MTVLVTGAGGFLGRAVVARLAADGGARVRCLVRTSAQCASLEARLGAEAAARVEICVGNLLSRGDAARAVEGVDTVYHLAASLRGSPADIFLNTVVASDSLLRALDPQPDTAVALVSSLGVYGVAGLPSGSRIDEQTPLEPHPERRDVYSHAKWRQEKLFRDWRDATGRRLVILRPGVIYGPGGAPMSARVGLNLFGLFLHLGGSSLLPLTYVDNCADAVAIAGRADGGAGEAFNVVDDGPITSRQYLRRYRRHVERRPFIRVPYALMQCLSRSTVWYHRHARGQLPAVFTPYKTASLWKGMRFDNAKLKRLGWRPSVPPEEGLARAFAYLREQARAGASS